MISAREPEPGTVGSTIAGAAAPLADAAVLYATDRSTTTLQKLERAAIGYAQHAVNVVRQSIGDDASLLYAANELLARYVRCVKRLEVLFPADPARGELPRPAIVELESTVGALEMLVQSGELRAPSRNPVTERRVEELPLCGRSLNCLDVCGIETVGQLITYDAARLLRVKNFGRKSLKEIRLVLASMGLALRGENPLPVEQCAERVPSRKTEPEPMLPEPEPVPLGAKRRPARIMPRPRPRPTLPRISYSVGEVARMFGRNPEAFRREIERRAEPNGQGRIAKLSFGVVAHKDEGEGRWRLIVPRNLLR